jgi:hypothetical protein
MWALTWPSPSKRSTASSYGGDARSATPPRPGSAATWCRPAADLGDPGRRLPPTPGDRRRRPSAHAPRRLAHEAVVQVVAGNAPQRPNGPPKPPPPAGPCRYFQASPSAARPRCSVGARPANRRARSSVRRRNSTIRTMLPPTQGTAGAARQSSASPATKTTTPEPGLALRAQSPLPRVLGRRAPRTRPEPGTVTTPGGTAGAPGRNGLQRSRAQQRRPGQRPHDPFCDPRRGRGQKFNSCRRGRLTGRLTPETMPQGSGHRIPRSAWDLRARRAVRGGSEP